MKVAFVFPGKGSQSVGVMAGFADVKPVEDTFAEASQLLGKDFWSMIANGPAEVLDLATSTQPLSTLKGG